MRIVTLIENLSYKQNLVGEHGLSIYIETDKKKILFDAGQSGLFVNNAKYMGIDLSQVDDVVISHGHYDHTGGLYAFLKENKKAKIHIKESAFQNKYRGQEKYIGFPYNINLFEDRFNFITEITQIDDEIYIIPEIEIFNEEDTHFTNMKIKNRYTVKEDEFTDEQFILIKNSSEISIITGCSHRGITNIIETGKKESDLPINLIMGGFHFDKEEDEKIKKIINYFESINPKKIGFSHCSGIEAFSLFKERMKDKVFYNYTGNEIRI
ncbi:MAG TPA: MBL fold metallo-hydrolase [Spirochaetota bacterium]|nr:MBL fold metallo-hydrolase [Spirochaetota bacterium]